MTRLDRAARALAEAADELQQENPPDRSERLGPREDDWLDRTGCHFCSAKWREAADRPKHRPNCPLRVYREAKAAASKRRP